MYTSVMLAMAIDCTRQEARSALDLGFTASQIICVETKDDVDVDALSAACGIIQNPLIRHLLIDLIAQREAAKRSGFAWSVTRDAGAPDAETSQ